MPSLRFEDVPSGCIALGETYNVAILLENDAGEPMSELEGVQVTLSVEAAHSQFDGAVAAYVAGGGISGIADTVDISCGEGIIELVFARAAPCDCLILRASVVAGSVEGSGQTVNDAEAEISGIPSNAGGSGGSGHADPSACIDQQDEDLSDIGQIVGRLRTAMHQSTSDNVGPKVKHYLMLIKGRMWNAEGNSRRLLDAGLLPLVLELIATAPINGGASVEAVLEALNVIEEVLVNKYAEVMPSCSSCRALIRPDNTMEVLAAKDMGTYHASCLRCRTCNESVHTQPFVRDTATMAPHHVECAKKAGVANDGVVIHCSVVLKSPHLTESDHVAAKAFWDSNQVEMLLTTLKGKWLPVNEYARDRCARVALRVAKAEVGPKEKREAFVAAIVTIILIISSCLVMISADAVTADTSASTSNNGACSGSEAYYIPDGRDYRGTIAVTRSGITCQNWASQQPHPHTTLLDESIGIGNNNYCRNPAPDAMSSPWCYTTSPSILYEACVVGPPCLGDTHSEKTSPVTFSAATTTDSSSTAPQIISPAVITLASPTFNATIYYTMDSSDAAPTIASSRLYDPAKQIVIVGSGYITIKAFALRPGFQLSDVTFVTYNILPPSLPSVAIFPLAPSVDPASPVLVTLAIQTTPGSTTDTSALEIRYIVVEGSQQDVTTVITPATSLLYKPGNPFWVRTSATVIAASFISQALAGTGASTAGSPAPSPMSRVFYSLSVAKASPPTVIPTAADPSVPVEGFGRVVFILQAATIQSPTFQVCNIGLSTAQATYVYNPLTCQDVPATSNAFHLTNVGTTVVAFRVCGQNLAPSDFVFVKATVRTMPDVRLSVPALVTYVGPVDVSASCVTNFAFFVNGEVRTPPIILSKEGTYVVESYSTTIFDKGPTARSVVTIEASNLPKPVFVPQPSADVPSSSFVFASPLSVLLRPLSYLSGHAYFTISVYKITASTGARVLIPSMSFANVPTNISTNMVFEGALATSVATASFSTYVVSATTFCSPGASDCTLVNQSTTTEITYNVADRLPAGSAVQSSPSFLLRVLDGVSPSIITQARVLSALFSTTTASSGLSFSVTVSVSGNNAFVQLVNLSPRLAVQYTSWLVADLSSFAFIRSARSGSLRLRLGLESPAASPVVSTDSSYKNVACLSSTALSASLATTHIAQITVAQCNSYCFLTFPTRTSVVSVLSLPDRCDCLDPSTFDPLTGMSNGNFVSDSTLCSAPCASSSSSASPSARTDTCGGTVVQPAKYGLWSSTVCSAYLAFVAPSIVQVYPSASAWELVNVTGVPFSDPVKKYSSTTTSILTLKLALNTGSTDLSNLVVQSGRIVIMKKSDATSCATDASGLWIAAMSSSSSSATTTSVSLNNAYASTFGFLTGISDQSLVLSTVGEYRICASFPNQFFNDSFTFVEIDNVPSANSYVEIIQGQYYPVAVLPKPGTYYASNKMTINVSTTAVGAFIKLSVDGSVPTLVNSSWTLAVISGPGTHTIVATAVASNQFAGSPFVATYNLVPQPTINIESAGAYLASARYTFSTTTIGSVRVSLAQYGKVQIGSCDQCRVQLLPFGSDCSSLNYQNAGSSSSSSSSSSGAGATLGPYSSATFALDAFAPTSSKAYISAEMLLSAPMSQDPIVVCVGGAPWYEIVSANVNDPVRDESQVLSIASAGIGFCSSAQQEALCSSQLPGARCSHVSFSGQDDFGCFCPGYLQKHYTSLFCDNNSNLPTVWNGTVFDLTKYGSTPSSGGGGGSGTESPNSQVAIKASWGAFVVLVVVYALALGALWYHKSVRSNDDEESNKEEGKEQEYATRVEMVSKETKQ